MIYIYFMDIFKCKLLYVYVKNHNYVPHEFIFQMFITCLMCTIVSIIRVNRVAEKKALKE